MIKDIDVNHVKYLLLKKFKYVIYDEKYECSYVFKFSNKDENIKKETILFKNITPLLDISYLSGDECEELCTLDKSIIYQAFQTLSGSRFSVDTFIKTYNLICQNDYYTINNEMLVNDTIYYIDSSLIDSVKFSLDCTIVRQSISRDVVCAFVDGIYRCFTVNEAVELGLCNINTRDDGSRYLTYQHNPTVWIDTIDLKYYTNFKYKRKRLCLNSVLIKHVCVQSMHDGDTVDDFIERYNSATYCKWYPTKDFYKYRKVDRVVGSIERPIFGRYPENKKKNTFDYIRISVRLAYVEGDTKKEQFQFLKKYIKDIHNKVKEKLENSKSFKKYGVPINYLQISNCTLTNDKCLDYIFEIKESLRVALIQEEDKG